MRLISFLFVLALFNNPVPATGQESGTLQPQTLRTLFSSALKNSETIKASAESMRNAEALFRKAMGDILPEFFYSRRAAIAQHTKTAHNGFFELVKSDFTLWGELASVRSANATLHQRRHEKRRTEQLLFQDVAAAFYGMLLAQEDAAASRKLAELARERAVELDRRVQLGKTRRADSLGQKVLIGSFESQREENERQVGERRDLLAYLIAAPVQAISVTDNEYIIEQATLESYLATASERPDVAAARENVISLQGDLEITRADFFPSFGVSVARYTDHALSSSREDWSVGASVSLPLWDWGSRGAAMDAAGADLAEGEAELSQALRLAELEIRNAYRDYETAKKQLLILKESVEFARQDYELQVEDDKRGLVTSLDVLASLDRLNNAELAYNSARLSVRLAAINLKIAAGSDPKDILR